MTDIKKSIAQGAASEITKRAVALLLPLLSTLVLALVPPVRDRILPVLPKPLLAVLVGISLSLNLALFFYVLRLRRSLSTKLTPRFGVLWSRDLVPHCPACSKPLGSYFCRAIAAGVKGRWGFNCVQCKGFISMYDDTGRVLELKEAKSLLSSQASELKPPAETLLEENEILILRYTATINESSIWPRTMSEITGLNIDVVRFHVHNLIEAGYLHGPVEVFGLAHKGRKYLKENNLLE